MRFVPFNKNILNRVKTTLYVRLLYAMAWYDEWESLWDCMLWLEIPMLWYEVVMLCYEISLVCYPMVYAVRGILELTKQCKKKCVMWVHNKRIAKSQSRYILHHYQSITNKTFTNK